MVSLDCPFCASEPDDIVLSNDLCFAKWDNYPVNDGHMLIIPKRHFSSYFDASVDEKESIWRLADKVNVLVEKQFAPDGFNLGINIGETAGQTVFHVHLHLIPRYKGDMKNPRGGVRGVIPEKQSY